MAVGMNGKPLPQSVEVSVIVIVGSKAVSHVVSGLNREGIHLTTAGGSEMQRELPG